MLLDFRLSEWRAFFQDNVRPKAVNLRIYLIVGGVLYSSNLKYKEMYSIGFPKINTNERE